MSAEEVDDYLTAVEEPKRSTLQALRRTIREIVPEAEEVISYRVPAFRLGGQTIGHTHVTATAIRRELAKVREVGYAVEREEALLGEAGVAAPIFDRRTEAIGAVGVAGPKERLLRRNRLPDVATAVIETARGISRDLGAPRWPARSSAKPSSR